MKIKHTILFLLFLATACSEDFLYRTPQGVLSDEVLATEEGLQHLLIGAYAALDGFVGWEHGNPWSSPATNWSFSDVVSDDAYKGSAAGECCYNWSQLEQFSPVPEHPYLLSKWKVVYDGISRCNDVLKIATKADKINEEQLNSIKGEARFLRGHYHFEGKKIFGNVPFINETIKDFSVGNTEDIWINIEEDFQYAIDHLPTSHGEEVGRATSWAAKAYLAKVYLFQHKYAAAKALLNDIVDNGPYALNAEYHTNFTTIGNNSLESIFALQSSVNDGAEGGENGNLGDMLNAPHGNNAPVGCCGFFQPSQNLVNAFKTTPNGLPMLGNFNEQDLKNDDGITSDEPFTESTHTLDPRLDWTVGRRGIPYLDWGDHPGEYWIRQQSYGGPYSNKKRMYYQIEEGINSQTNGWGGLATALNYEFIRHADVLLWLAECEVELGNLEKARNLVNQIRQRAMNSDDFVKNDDGTDAANYVIGLYQTTWTDIDDARKMVRFERRLELALEGHRFFDLVRWGVAENVMNNYLQEEQNKRPHLLGVFMESKHIYQPIPLQAIEESIVDGVPQMVQNNGY